MRARYDFSSCSAVADQLCSVLEENIRHEASDVESVADVDNSSFVNSEVCIVSLLVGNSASDVIACTRCSSDTANWSRGRTA